MTMQIDGQITAREAREQAQARIGMDAKKMLETIYKQIRTAVAQNRMGCGAGVYLSNSGAHAIVRQHLEGNGFKIRNHSGDQRDPRDHDWTEISW